jgi:GntR family transcriptional repressor for pyruvate dehydrogenase complex
LRIDLEPLSAGRRSDVLFEQLRARICAGSLAVGEQLPNERDLAEAAGVNRASVREAVKRLEFLELVEVRHGQGTFVRAPGASSSLQLVESLLADPRSVTPDLLAQVLEFRRDMTLRVVELAACNRSDAQVIRARELVEREGVEGRDPERALALDLEFNRLLGEATGNLLYQLVTNLFTKLVKRLGPLYYNERRDTARSLDTHRRLLAAIEARDAAAARRIVEDMLVYSEAAIAAEVQRLVASGALGPATGGRAA